MVTLNFQTKKKYEVLDITTEVERVLEGDGVVMVFVPHATAAIVLNESADPKVGEDLLDALNKLIPEGVWQHDRIDDNAAAHIKASILGPSELIPFKGGKLVLGAWQNIFLVDLDGPRNRKVIVKIL